MTEAWEWGSVEHPSSHVHAGPLCYGEPVKLLRPRGKLRFDYYGQRVDEKGNPA
jgi:hypothetical protein